MNADVKLGDIPGAYRKAKKRILFLDYDGTLVPFRDRPEDSILGKTVRSIIQKLTLPSQNHVYIISGRDKDFLAQQFSGIPAGLIAEHGFLVREAGGDWRYTVSVNNNWKEAINGIFDAFKPLFPGTFVEEKESSLVYHYRTAAEDEGDRIRSMIRTEFLTLQQRFPDLELLDGEKVIEIKPRNFSKGYAASTIIRGGTYDFILAAGDDITDESLFAELGRNSFTIKIGLNSTCARYHLPDQAQFICFLEELASQ